MSAGHSKFAVGAGYGWFYGFALLITVAAVDTGVISYFTTLTHNWFGWNLDPGGRECPSRVHRTRQG